MPTEAQAKETIAARWVAAWGATTPFSLGNEAATPPAAAALFAALWFGPLTERQLTQGPEGTRRFEFRGTVVVRLFGPLDVGESPLATLAGTVRTALASQTITAASGSVHTWAGNGVSAKQGSWWTNTLTIPFRFYDRR